MNVMLHSYNNKRSVPDATATVTGQWPHNTVTAVVYRVDERESAPAEGRAPGRGRHFPRDWCCHSGEDKPSGRVVRGSNNVS